MPIGAFIRVNQLIVIGCGLMLMGYFWRHYQATIWSDTVPVPKEFRIIIFSCGLLTLLKGI